MCEEALVQRLREGDRRAFEAVFDLHADGVFSLLRRLSGCAATADDLLQDTFLKLAAAARDLPPGTRLGPYVFAIARNTWVSYRRARRFDLAATMDDLARAGPAPEHDVAWGELSARTVAALEALPPELRETLALSLSPLEAADVAHALGVTEEAYRKRLSRARAVLRDALGACYTEVLP